MVNLDAFYRVSDEAVEEVFRIVERLKDGLSGGFQDEEAYDSAEAIQKACLFALNSSSDHKALVLELIELSGIDYNEN